MEKVFAVAMSIRIGESHHVAPVSVCYAASEEAAEAKVLERFDETVVKLYGEQALGKCEVLAYSAIEVPISVYDRLEPTNADA